MNGLYTSILVLHVLVAVLGLGSIVSIAILALVTRKTGDIPADLVQWLSPLLRLSAVSLAAMLITGVLLDVTAKGAFDRAWWFRGSVLLLIAAGALNGGARRTVRLGFAKHSVGGSATTLRRVERLAYGMCAIVAGITVLMEVKPF